jgi:sigma-B regulation protein RsbU (phosphoserine phosphatase)
MSNASPTASAIALPGFDLAGASAFLHARGGDYHDFLDTGDGALMVAVGDVSGHDGAAAVLVERVRAALRERPARPGGLGRLMEAINQDLAARAEAGRFMTLFLAVLGADERSIHWVNAGHGPALAYDPVADRFDEVVGVDIPLGIDPAWRYHELVHVGWPAGAVLTVGTDGVTEARNPAGDMYGADRLRAAVRAAAAAPAETIVRAVGADIDAFRQGRPAGDDVTLVVVKAV